ncbi:MAG TPA: class I SAM-dependent methyltransferase [Bacillota bacterium]|nr:class I SAM-dependent methyltransferase [Bacillota bacterium]
MKASNAIEWFSENAVAFDSQYQDDPNFKERYEIWTKTINKYSDSNYQVLDIGCGSGIFSFYSAQVNGAVVGVDGSDEMLTLCEKEKTRRNCKNIRFLKADIRFLETAAMGKADLIICSSVLEYMEDLDASLKMIASLLKKNGVLIASLPNRSSFYRKLEPLLFKISGRFKYYEYVKQVLTLKTIAVKMKEFGFDLLESRYYAQTPLLSRVFRQVGLPKYSDNLILFVARQR